jgi:hypothetical protein
MKSKLYVISFGNNKYYTKLSNYNVNKITKRYKNSIGIVYHKEDLPRDMINFCDKHKKGYGFMIWKPFIVKKTLEMMSTNDILLYVDGRVFYSGGKIREIQMLTNDDKLEAIFWKLDGLFEFQYSKGDFFNKLQINNPLIKQSSQIGSTFFFIKKKPQIEVLVYNWFMFMNDNRNMFITDTSDIPNEIGYIAQRHDQSILSLLVKASKNLNVEFITDKQVSRGKIKPHSLPHDDEFPHYLSHIPLRVMRVAYLLKKTRPLNLLFNRIF